MIVNPFAPPPFLGSSRHAAPPVLPRPVPLAAATVAPAVRAPKPAPVRAVSTTKASAHPGKQGAPPRADSHRALILDVARGLPQPWHTTDLVLACWRAYPERFGIPGHPQYPDTNRVLCKLPDLAARGHVSAIGVRTYVVTPSGRRA